MTITLRIYALVNIIYCIYCWFVGSLQRGVVFLLLDKLGLLHLAPVIVVNSTSAALRMNNNAIYLLQHFKFQFSSSKIVLLF